MLNRDVTTIELPKAYTRLICYDMPPCKSWKIHKNKIKSRIQDITTIVDF